MYEKIHIMDDVIENESSGDRGLSVSAHVDTLGKVILELGNSMTIRTDWQGAVSLSEILRDAVAKIEAIQANGARLLELATYRRTSAYSSAGLSPTEIDVVESYIEEDSDGCFIETTAYVKLLNHFCDTEAMPYEVASQPLSNECTDDPDDWILDHLRKQ
jgi:hypothetical protein